MDMKASYSKGEEDKRSQLFHINVQEKKTKIDAFFYRSSQVNHILEDLVQKLELGNLSLFISIPTWMGKQEGEYASHTPM